MSITFIITTFNVEPYIQQCLENLHPCLRPGDQVVLVDDGSTDKTNEVIQDFVNFGGFGGGVRWTPIWLGTNTIGGVGIPGNIGLDHADCDTVFFVDGDDYLIPDEFLKARRHYEANLTDICFTDYLEFDQQTNQTQPPADAKKWNELPLLKGSEIIRLAAIDFIAVPWRKFYRAAFLRHNRIRFPEGDFFFEDNTFHWRACTLANSIGFSRHIVCHHRVNRPEQTMASTGLELVAFFTHFRTIMTELPEGRDDLRRQAARWLISNMAWHIPRLQQAAFYIYASHAREALQKIEDSDWQELAAEMSETITWHYSECLRQGRTWDVVQAWTMNMDRAMLSRIDHDIRSISNRLHELEQQARITSNILQAQQAIEEFVSFQKLYGNT